jgi:hypothetical protein
MNAGHLLWNPRRAWAGANLCKDRPLGRIPASENGFVVVPGLGCSLVGFVIDGRHGLF